MPHVMVGRGFFLALCAVGATAIGFTTYTGPIEGAGTDPSLRALIVRALHDSEPALPPASEYLPVERESGADSVESGSRQEGAHRDGPAPQVTDWLRRAAQADSSALRAWLGDWVRATVTTDHDRMHLTLYRIALHPGCPLLSTLRTTNARSADWGVRTTRIESTCPALSGEVSDQRD